MHKNIIQVFCDLLQIACGDKYVLALLSYENYEMICWLCKLNSLDWFMFFWRYFDIESDFLHM